MGVNWYTNPQAPACHFLFTQGIFSQKHWVEGLQIERERSEDSFVVQFTLIASEEFSQESHVLQSKLDILFMTKLQSRLYQTVTVRHTHSHTQTHTQTHTHTQTRTHTHALINTKCTQTYIHKQTNAHTHTFTHSWHS